MRILALSYYFPPEIGSGPHIPYELCESLAAMGHDVTAVTGFPRYHLSAMPPQYRRRLFHRETMGGVNVLRINAPNAYSKRTVVRGIAQQIAPWIFALRALPIERPDVVWTMTPPLAMGLAARIVAARFRAPCVVNVQDLFPRCAVDLGILRNRLLIAYFEAMERYIYRHAAAVTGISGGYREHIVAKGAEPDRTFTIFNWVDTELIRPSDRMNDFRAAHGLGADFLAVFAGTMGWSQGMDTIIDAAQLLTERRDLQFLFVGDGVELPRMRQRAAGMPNVRFLPMQTREVYPQVLAASDVSLVTLRPEAVGPTVPSKTATIMAAGRPIVASVPLQSDSARLIDDAQCGLVAPAGDAQALAAAVLSLKNDAEALARMRIRGRQYAERHLSRTVCVRQNEEVFLQSIERHRARRRSARRRPGGPA